MAVPENIDIVVGKLYAAQKTIFQLTLNIQEISARLLEDFDIGDSGETDEYEEDISKLE